MKKSVLSAILICLTTILYSQTWFDIGVKGGIGSSFMYNSQIFDDQLIVHKFKMGSAIGGKIGFNFVQEHQITFDVLKSSFTQGFTYVPEDSQVPGDESLREFRIDGLDMLLMYRANRNGTYFEIGPQWSTYSKVGFSDNGSTVFSEKEVAEMITKSNFGMAVGFGGYIFGTDNFGVATGVRFNYMFDDLATENGATANFPILRQTGKTNATHNIGAMFIIEINYDFGYLVSSRCGQRTKLFVF